MDDQTSSSGSFAEQLHNLAINETWGWLLKLVIGLFVILIAGYGLRKIVNAIQKRFKSKHDWVTKLDWIVYPPVDTALWVIGIVFIIDAMGNKFGFTNVVSFIPKMRNVAIIVCGTWLLLRWKKEMQAALLRKKKGKIKATEGMYQVVGRLTSIGVLLLSVITILEVIGLDIVPIVTFGGIGVAALGFAAKDLIGNFFGGVLVHLTRHFSVGDYIIVEGQHIEGFVEEIGWYLTRVCGRDKRPHFVPNGYFTTAVVMNATRRSHWRVKETVGIRYEDFEKVKGVNTKIKAMLKKHPQVDTDQPVIVTLDAISAYSLDLSYDCCTTPDGYAKFLELREELFLTIYEIIQSVGAEVPFPITTVRVEK